MPKYTDQDLSQAVKAVEEGAISYRKASQKFDVPLATLCDHVKERSTHGVKKGRKTSISKEVEEKMIRSIQNCATSGFPLTKRQVLEKVGRLCKELEFKTQTDPGREILEMSQATLSSTDHRNPECSSHNRLINMTEEKVTAYYFRDLHRLIYDNNLSAEDIWNMDETGLQFTHKPSKVVAGKGTSVLHSRTSDSKESLTVVACINASGKSMPPLCIVKGKTQKSGESFATYIGPKDTMWTYQQKGWIENCLGVEWFESVFLQNCGHRRPKMLLLDSHSSHEVIDLLEKAREENIHIFALPPHTTQALQPLDKVVLKPFKQRYGSTCTTFMHENPSKFIDKSSFPMMLKEAWEVLNDATLLKSAFQSTVVYPPNEFAIDRSQFMPAQYLQGSANMSMPESIIDDQPEPETMANLLMTEPAEFVDQPVPRPVTHKAHIMHMINPQYLPV